MRLTRFRLQLPSCAVPQSIAIILAAAGLYSDSDRLPDFQNSQSHWQILVKHLAGVRVRPVVQVLLQYLLPESVFQGLHRATEKTDAPGFRLLIGQTALMFRSVSLQD